MTKCRRQANCDENLREVVIIYLVNQIPPSSPIPYALSLTNLRSLLAIRAITLMGQVGVLIYISTVKESTQSLLGLGVGVMVLGVLTAISLWRTTKPWPVSTREFVLQLLVDVIGWTALMYFSGGADNPFISYYIVPVVVAAAVLPWRYTWLIAIVSLAAYSSLFLYSQPFPLFAPPGGMHHGNGFSVHTLGMWLNFLFSAGLITFFVVRMATLLRQQDARETQRREVGMRNDQILAVASLAAGTAHELATPLATMTMLVDELLQDQALSQTTRADCELLRAQLQQCRSTLAALSHTAETSRSGEFERVSAEEFVESAVARWGLRRPRVTRQYDCLGKQPAPLLVCDLTLRQAIENLLNNAADSGSQRISVTLDWDAQFIVMEIRDWGPGVPPQLLQCLHSGDRNSDTGGLGIGLLLSRSAVERHGGQLSLSNAPDGGTIARIRLPASPPAASPGRSA
ncbi:Sensor histidine kinase RegB [Halioglobus japonicus]|nr:Sensor histidine kinase RegB [Halioglobus japonicus]